MAASTSNQSFNPNQYQYQYPYPSNVFVPSFVSVKLTGKSTYNVWYYQMLILLRSHNMLDFVNGKIVSPKRDEKATEEHMDAWIRSDSLVQGWILGSLSDQVAINVVNQLTSRHANAEFTAKDAWDELQRIYGPELPKQPAVNEMTTRKESKSKSVEEMPPEQIAELEAYLLSTRTHLYYSITRGDLRLVASSDYRGFPVTAKLTTNGDTALHVAVGTCTNNQDIFQYLLENLPYGTNLLDVRNSDGSTLLHVAAIVGNTGAAKILFQKSPDMLLSQDNKGHTPLAISLSNMRIQTSNCMLDYIEKTHKQEWRNKRPAINRANIRRQMSVGLLYYIVEESDEQESRKYDTLFTGPTGDELLVLAISTKDFGLAHRLFFNYKTIHSEAPLMAIAHNFPHLSFWGRLAYVDEIHDYEGILDDFYRYDDCARAMRLVFPTQDFGCNKVSIKIIIMAIVRPFFGKGFWNYHYALSLVSDICGLIQKKIDISNHPRFYSNPVLEATRQNAHKAVIGIVDLFPEAVWSVNEDGHNFIQFAVINRSEKVYSLLYQMSEHRNIYKTMEDSSRNNLLHLAARLAPTNKLKIISGAALQMQRELQWFKEVEGFVCPLNTTQKNSAGETPEMVFSREHTELLIKGEEWMKKTAESYTITAALITTIVFAAAITVPGGNDQNKGTPLFTNKPAFTIFAISDAVSLFTAVTSLLMFLSILTTRFSEKDFLFKLPKRLIIGLASLFISTTAMIIAFGATLLLVFGQGNLWVLIPIGALTCLPIISFVTLQFPLIIDLISATYVRSIFDKTKSNLPFY
ncbi:uncharacterized protein [Rutidosis leptorrhynchoides]|uniref:uncharacterized protein n=1 Tax=Rutidosis leptorrhynchoides TaxID=125765 RepID=UPI003A992B38